MEIKRTLVLDSSESLSRALPELDEVPAVIVTRNGKYYGIIDHRSLSAGMRLPQNVKCESAVVKPPVLMESSNLLERVDAFLLGHFKALPVCDDELKPIGITTRVELLKEMVVEGMVPKMSVDEMMSSPVFTIDESRTIADVKNAMKEKKSRRLVVVRGGNMVGVVSAFDIGAWTAKTNLLASGRKDIRQSGSINADNMKMSGFLRPDMVVVKEGASLDEAVRKMIDKQASMAIVASGSKPLGIVSALDIFKKVRDSSGESATINVSGLREDNISYYKHIQDRMGGVLEKFSKSFNITNCNVHVKEGKSTFVVNVYFDLDKGHVSLKEEGGSLKETIDEIAVEMSNVLRKKKDIRKVKPRVRNAQ